MPVESTLVDARVAAVASRQHGRIAHDQLRALGITQGQITGRVRRGALIPDGHGVYAVGHVAPSRAAALMTATLMCGPDALISHDHAVALHGLNPPWVDPPSLTAVHVTITPRRRRGRGSQLIVHQARIEPVDRAAIDGIPCTGAARTILDMAPGSTMRRLERLADQAAVDRKAGVADLRAVLERYPRRRGAARLRRVVAAHDRFGRSPAARRRSGCWAWCAARGSRSRAATCASGG